LLGRMKRPFKKRILRKDNRWKNTHPKGDYLAVLFLLSLVFLMATGFISLYLWFITSPFFRIEEIRVTGCRELTEKEVLSLAGLKPNQTLLSVNLEAMARRISVNPWVKQISLRREFPRRLIIEVKEKKPLALCRIGEELFFVDEEGNLFKRLTAEDEVNFPIITGMDKMLKSQVFAQVLFLIKYLAKTGDGLSVNEVAEIAIDEERGISLISERGYQVRMGFDAIEEKIKRLQKVLATLQLKGLSDPYIMVDLRDVNRVYVVNREKGKLKETKLQKGGLRI